MKNTVNITMTIHEAKVAHQYLSNYTPPKGCGWKQRTQTRAAWRIQFAMMAWYRRQKEAA